jgi:hypothetical protein
MVPPGLGGLGSGWPLHRRLDSARQTPGRRARLRVEIVMNGFLDRPDSFCIPLAALRWAGIDSGFWLSGSSGSLSFTE